MARSYSFYIDEGGPRQTRVEVREDLPASPGFDPSNPGSEDLEVAWAQAGSETYLSVRARPGVDCRYIYELEAQAVGNSLAAGKRDTELYLGSVPFAKRIGLCAGKGNHGQAVVHEDDRTVELLLPKHVWSAFEGEITQEVAAQVAGLEKTIARRWLRSGMRGRVGAMVQEDVARALADHEHMGAGHIRRGSSGPGLSG